MHVLKNNRSSCCSFDFTLFFARNLGDCNSNPVTSPKSTDQQYILLMLFTTSYSISARFVGSIELKVFVS